MILLQYLGRSTLNQIQKPSSYSGRAFRAKIGIGFPRISFSRRVASSSSSSFLPCVTSNNRFDHQIQGTNGDDDDADVTPHRPRELNCHVRSSLSLSQATLIDPRLIQILHTSRVHVRCFYKGWFGGPRDASRWHKMKIYILQGTAKTRMEYFHVDTWQFQFFRVAIMQLGLDWIALYGFLSFSIQRVKGKGKSMRRVQ